MTTFNPGTILATPGALQALRQSGQRVGDLLLRHLNGDWGDVCPEDARRNDTALRDGGRLLSSYTTRDNEKLWIITEAENDRGQRESTTVLLPCEY